MNKNKSFSTQIPNVDSHRTIWDTYERAREPFAIRRVPSRSIIEDPAIARRPTRRAPPSTLIQEQDLRTNERVLSRGHVERVSRHIAVDHDAMDSNPIRGRGRRRSVAASL